MYTTYRLMGNNNNITLNKCHIKYANMIMQIKRWPGKIVNLEQSRAISDNLGQSRAISDNLGQSRAIAGTREDVFRARYTVVVYVVGHTV